MWAGLADCLETVSGLESVLLGEPSSVHEFPAVYGALQDVTRTQAGQVTAMRYTFLLRLVIRWQEREEAEAELLSYVNSIPAAVDADPLLGGAITQGLAKVTFGLAGFIELGGTTYRVLDFTADVLEKGAYQGGL